MTHPAGHRTRISIHDAIEWCEDCDWTRILPIEEYEDARAEADARERGVLPGHEDIDYLALADYWDHIATNGYGDV